MARRWALAMVGVACATLLAGCPPKDYDQSADRAAMLRSNDRVSNVPWSKPDGGENSGQLGALANDPRIGGSPR